MDLTVALKGNPSSNGKSTGAENDGMIVRNSKRAKFMASYYHQNFSMPDSLVFYVAKNPKTWKLYQKMVKSCKYFFVKNPILVIDKQLNHYGSQWTIMKTPYDMNQTKSKLWIASCLTVFDRNYITTEMTDQNILTSIIPKLYRCDVLSLFLLKQVISYDDLPLLISSAEMIRFDQVVVKHEDGSNVDIQKIVEIASNATLIDISHPTITSKTMEELLKIPNFTSLRRVTLENVPEAFDITCRQSYVPTKV